YEIRRIDPERVGDERDLSADYIICQAEVLDSAFEEMLISRGYRFLDRLLCFEIEVNAVKGFSIGMVPDVLFSYDEEYDDSVYHTAFQAFTTDRRFHLNPVFDQQAANDVIEAYINYYKRKGFRIYKAKYGGELLGFTIVDNVDTNRNYFENVLGATKPGIKGKAIAALLYRFMMRAEGEKYRKYVGCVSSSNLASINLHNALGGRVKRIYDDFISSSSRGYASLHHLPVVFPALRASLHNR
ncbi:MAG: hypothetical protein IKH88_07830, partial [Prevotella sp.]|nr:hypothetical protein [Prevotella sp.]